MAVGEESKLGFSNRFGSGPIDKMVYDLPALESCHSRNRATSQRRFRVGPRTGTVPPLNRNNDVSGILTRHRSNHNECLLTGIESSRICFYEARPSLVYVYGLIWPRVPDRPSRSRHIFDISLTTVPTVCSTFQQTMASVAPHESWEPVLRFRTPDRKRCTRGFPDLSSVSGSAPCSLDLRRDSPDPPLEGLSYAYSHRATGRPNSQARSWIQEDLFQRGPPDGDTPRSSCAKRTRSIGGHCR